MAGSVSAHRKLSSASFFTIDKVLIPADEAVPEPPAVVPATRLLTFGTWTTDEIREVAGDPLLLSQTPASGAHFGLLGADQAEHLQVLLAQVLLGACTPILTASGLPIFGGLKPEEICGSLPQPGPGSELLRMAPALPL